MGAAKDAYVSAVKASLSRDEVYKAPVSSGYRGRSAKERREDDNYERLFNLTKDFVQNPTTENLTTINQYGGGGLTLLQDENKNTTLTIVDNTGGEQIIDINKDTDPAYLQEIIYMSQVGGNTAAGAIFEKNRRGTANKLGKGITTKDYTAKITKPKTKNKNTNELSYAEKQKVERLSKQLGELETELSKLSLGREEYKGMDVLERTKTRALLEKRIKDLEGKIGGTGTGTGTGTGDGIFETE
jgi:hypothetical protein